MGSSAPRGHCAPGAGSGSSRQFVPPRHPSADAAVAVGLVRSPSIARARATDCRTRARAGRNAAAIEDGRDQAPAFPASIEAAPPALDVVRIAEMAISPARAQARPGVGRKQVEPGRRSGAGPCLATGDRRRMQILGMGNRFDGLAFVEAVRRPYGGSRRRPAQEVRAGERRLERNAGNVRSAPAKLAAKRPQVRQRQEDVAAVADRRDGPQLRSPLRYI